MHKLKFTLLSVAVLGLGIGVYYTWQTRQNNNTKAKDSVLVDTQLLASVKHQSNPTAGISHLADGLVPPTNHWFSGIVFGPTPNAVFPMPLSFKPSNSGFSFGLPKVTATSNTIFGSYNEAVTAQIDADNYKISRYDELSATLDYTKGNTVIGHTTVAEGSPFISYKANTTQTVRIHLNFQKVTDNLYQVNVGDQVYGLYVTTAGSVAGGDTTTVSLGNGDGLTVFAVAKNMNVSDMSTYAQNAVESVDVNYRVQTSMVSTTLSYNVKNQPTLFAALPSQKITTAKKLSGTYDTIYGSLSLYSGNSFTFDTPKVSPSNQLFLNKLSQSDKNTLIGYLRSDATATILQKTDSYFGAKELYRAANLYDLAKQLGQNDIANALHDQLLNTFDQWLDPAGYQSRSNRYFYYDTTFKGLVAAQASFGSDQFNDHHFHYGYFLYAASILAKYDSAFLKAHGAFVNLIAADIASPVAGKDFPQRRNFDPYFGHSWASGNGVFADGNNQESSSEAINAWNGAAMWGAVSGQNNLQADATWMLSSEARASESYWTNIDTSQTQYKGYTHSTVGINWGGKRDYATFFSADANAVVGIQLIPLNPSMIFLQDEGSRITSNIATVVSNDNYNKQFGDYLLMYRSLVDKKGALPLAQALDASSIDDANSRTYMIAWILSQSN